MQLAVTTITSVIPGEKLAKPFSHVVCCYEMLEILAGCRGVVVYCFECDFIIGQVHAWDQMLEILAGCRGVVVYYFECDFVIGQVHAWDQM